MESKNEFEETLKSPFGVTSWLVLSILSVVLVVLVYGVFQQLVLGIPFGTKHLSNPLLVGIAVFILVDLLGTVVFLVSLRLEIVVHQGLRFRMPPLKGKWTHVPFSEIQSAESVVVHPFAGFGGTGIRLAKRQVAYLVNVKTGVRITLNDGRRYVLSSLKPETLTGLLS